MSLPIMVASVFLGMIFPFSSRTILFLIIVLLFEIQTTIRAVDISDKFGNCSVKSSYKANNSSVSFTINLPEVKHKEYLALEFNENVNYALVFISISSSSTSAGFLDVGVYEDMWGGDIVYKHDVRFDPERHRVFKIGFPSIQKFPIIVQYTEKIFDPNYYATFNVTILPAYEIDQKTSMCRNNHGKINESLQTDSVYTVPMCFNCSEILTETEELHLQQKFPEFRKNLFEGCRKGDNATGKQPMEDKATGKKTMEIDYSRGVDISDQFGKCPVKSPYNASTSPVSFTINLPELKNGEYLALEFDENVDYALVIISANSSDIRAGFLGLGVYGIMFSEDIILRHFERFDPGRHRVFQIGFPSLQNHPIIVKYSEKIFDPTNYVIFNVTILPAYEIDPDTSSCPKNTLKINESLQTDSLSSTVVPMCFNCNLKERVTEKQSLHLQKFPEFLTGISKGCTEEVEDTDNKLISVILGVVLPIIFIISLIGLILIVICKWRRVIVTKFNRSRRRSFITVDHIDSESKKMSNKPENETIKEEQSSSVSVEMEPLKTKLTDEGQSFIPETSDDVVCVMTHRKSSKSRNKNEEEDSPPVHKKSPFIHHGIAKCDDFVDARPAEGDKCSGSYSVAVSESCELETIS